MESMKEVLIDSLRPSKLNVHPPLSAPEFAQLVNSIRKHGLIDPIRVWQGEIISGENRWRACKKLGWKRIAAIELPASTSTDELVEINDKANFGRRQYDAAKRQAVILARFEELLRADERKPYRMPDGTVVKNKAVYIAEKTGLPIDTIRPDLAEIGRALKRKDQPPRRWRNTLTDEQERLGKEIVRDFARMEALDERLTARFKRERKRILERKANLVKKAQAIPGGIKRLKEMFGKK